MLAEITAFLRVSGSLRLAGGGRFTIVAATENPAIARHYKKLIKEYFDSNAGLEVGGSQMPGRSRKGGYRYSLTIPPDEKSGQILRETGMMLIREGNDYLSDGIYQPIVRTKCCRRAYLRGLFLGCGTMSDPHRGYQMEFLVGSRQMALDTKKLIGTFEDLAANIAERRDEHVVYLKRAEYISDMLALIGAEGKLLEFENIRIGRGLKQAANRISNCDNANVDRTLTASGEQLHTIEILEQRLGLARELLLVYLPERLCGGLRQLAHDHTARGERLPVPGEGPPEAVRRQGGVEGAPYRRGGDGRPGVHELESQRADPPCSLVVLGELQVPSSHTDV